MIRLILPALLASCVASPVAAQAQCAGLADVLAGLERNYAEVVRTRALTAQSTLLIITASEAGTWTALIVTADGQACLIAVGAAFEAVEPTVPNEPA
jgi:hypothetical protein